MTASGEGARRRRIIVAITGASGAIYGERLLKALLEEGHRVELAFDPRRVPPAELIARITQAHAVHDVTVAEPPIEEIIARLYSKEENGAG